MLCVLFTILILLAQGSDVEEVCGRSIDTSVPEATGQAMLQIRAAQNEMRSAGGPVGDPNKADASVLDMEERQGMVNWASSVSSVWEGRFSRVCSLMNKSTSENMQKANLSRGTCSSKSKGIGKDAPLDETGYLMVAKANCTDLDCTLLPECEKKGLNEEMAEFIRRTILSLDMDVCDEDGLRGLVPWFTCETLGPKTPPSSDFTGNFAELVANLRQSQPPVKCAFVAPTNTCKPLPPDEASECRKRDIPLPSPDVTCPR